MGMIFALAILLNKSVGRKLTIAFLLICIIENAVAFGIIYALIMGA